MEKIKADFKDVTEKIQQYVDCKPIKPCKELLVTFGAEERNTTSVAEIKQIITSKNNLQSKSILGLDGMSDQQL